MLLDDSSNLKKFFYVWFRIIKLNLFFMFHSVSEELDLTMFSIAAIWVSNLCISIPLSSVLLKSAFWKHYGVFQVTYDPHDPYDVYTGSKLAIAIVLPIIFGVLAAFYAFSYLLFKKPD